jgi:predicted O-methyltransferase YrrM
MYSPFTLACKYFAWWRKASNGKGHGMHSPFVFDFITRLLNDKTIYPDYGKVEGLRKKLLKDATVLKVDDLGAGSGHTDGDRRTVSSIARRVAKPKKWGQLLFRMVKHYHPQSILELGTSLGISTAYLALADPNARVTSVEGSPMIAARAKENLGDLDINNVHLMVGHFDECLPEILKEEKNWDLVFVDGNHRKEPTLSYFEMIMARSGPDSIIIFDDIHWSAEMEEAWDMIRRDPRVRCSLDLFFVGLVFFREEFHEKLDFSIRS